MKEKKEPTVLGITAVRNVDVPELKEIIRCENPATGKRLSVCYLEDDGKRVLSFATTAVPYEARAQAGRSLWFDVDSGEWGASAPTCDEDVGRIRDAKLDAVEAGRIAEACGLDAVARAVLAALVVYCRNLTTRRFAICTPACRARAAGQMQGRPGRIARAACAAYIWNMSTMCFKKMSPLPLRFVTYSLSKRMVLPL